MQAKADKDEAENEDFNPSDSPLRGVSSDDFFLISWQDTEKELFPGSGDDVSLYHPKISHVFLFVMIFQHAEKPKRSVVR